GPGQPGYPDPPRRQHARPSWRPKPKPEPCPPGPGRTPAIALASAHTRSSAPIREIRGSRTGNDSADRATPRHLISRRPGSGKMPTMKSGGRDLTRGPIAPTLLVFALPILGGNVLQSLNGSVNAIWVGRFLGEHALTATANANNIMFFLIGAVFGVGMAATILVAQAMGSKDMVQARRVIGTSASFFLCVSILIALAGLPLSRAI